MQKRQKTNRVQRWLGFILFTAVLAAPLTHSQAAVLHLGGRQFDPLAHDAKESLIPAGTVIKRLSQKSVAPQSASAGAGYYIVQFEGPVLPQWRTALEDTGAVVLDYIPDFAYIVRLPESKKEAVHALEHVRWIGAYEPDYRISTAAKALSTLSVPGGEERLDNGQVRVRMDAFPGESPAAITLGIKALGGNIEDIHESEWGIRITAALDPEKISEAAKILGIKWVELRKTPRTSNEVAATIAHVRQAGIRADGFFGEGQIIAVCDSGLDKGSTTDVHPDFLDGYGFSRVLDIYSWGDDSYLSDLDGHGTHVAGSVLGNGACSGADPAGNWFPHNSHAGMAPKALLVYQAVSDQTSSSLPGIPSDLKSLFQQALDAGASIHTNSWGTSGVGDYSGESADVDQFCWSQKQFLIVFAVGNAGYDKNMDGVTDGYCIDTPATAKNCLSVGASESLRADGGFARRGYGEFRTYADPLASDYLSDNPRGLAAFSSRGPCMDGRTKPDLVAPGTNILSTRSALQESDGWGAYNDRYFYSGGSSMATPIAAGAAAVLREYLIQKVDVFHSTPPSSAMLKACLINGAVDIAPGQYGDGEAREIRRTPGPAAGWGRLDLERTVAPEFPFFNTYVDETQGIETGETAVYTVQGESPDTPLRITLSWTDYPAAQAAGGGLVNDLDLMVTDQNGQIFYPDNARGQTGMSKALYVESVSTTLDWEQVAIRLTPDAYPKRLDSLFWAAKNPDNIAADVDIDVYQADAQGLPAGDPLFSTSMAYCPSGEYAVPVGTEVTQGDLVAVFTFSSTNGMQIYAAEDGNPTGRGLVNRGNGLEISDTTPAIGGIFFSTHASETFDRVNNLVGITIENPSGQYAVTVNGYNVPQGPQPFALVISGSVIPEAPPRAEIPFWRERR